MSTREFLNSNPCWLVAGLDAPKESVKYILIPLALRALATSATRLLARSEGLLSKEELLPASMTPLSEGRLEIIFFDSADRVELCLEKLKEKGVDKCRRGCRCDAGNRYLHRLKYPSPHDNFT